MGNSRRSYHALICKELINYRNQTRGHAKIYVETRKEKKSWREFHYNLKKLIMVDA